MVEEFAEWNPAGTVILPGGEVTLDMVELLAVAGACRERGLSLILLTNGSNVTDSAAAEAVSRSGATCIVVSLDGHTAEIHDYTRGVRGAFEETTAAIRRLTAATREADHPAMIMTACVIFDRNLSSFPEYVEYCRALGVRHVDLQVLAHTFSNAHKSRDLFFEKHFWHSAKAKARAKQFFAEFLERYAEDPFVVKKPDDLPWICAYIDDPGFRTESPVCGSHYRNLMVDSQGNVALCFNTGAILRDPFVGNVRHRGLRELWSSIKAAGDREVMDLCRLNCGALNCHRRPTWTARAGLP